MAASQAADAAAMLTAQPAAPSEADLARLGEALAAARTRRGLDRTILARQLAMSARQLQEIEEGGSSAFYSAQHKAWAARKAAQYLGVMTPAD